MFQKLKKEMEDWKKQFEMMTPEALKRAAAVPSGDGEKISLDDVEQYLSSLEEQHSVSVISNLPETAQIIFNMKWAFLKNDSTGFVTSDDPVVLLRPESIKKYGPGTIGSLPGLIYKDVELTLPLSNDLLLLAGWKLEKNSFLPADDKMAKIFNHKTITHSSERIITNSEEKARAIKIKYTETALNQPKK